MGSRPTTWFQPSGDSTVITPEALREVFAQAQDNVHRYFTNNHADPATGRIEIGDDRYVLVRASALSTDFLDSITQLYDDRDHDEAQAIGRAFLFDIAHTIGKNDARSFHKKMGLTEPIARLAAGPVHFSYSGWALVRLMEESEPSLDDNFFLRYEHPYSFEADSWLREGRQSHGPVCIMNAGYSSGWCEESFRMPLTAVEIDCKARGDDACSFVMAPPHRIEDRLREIRPSIGADIRIPRYFGRKVEEDALRRNERRLTSILAAMPMPVLITSERGTLQFSNTHAEDVFGSLGTGALFERPGTLDELFARVKDGERIHAREHRMFRSDGTPFAALVSCYPLLLPDGERGMVLSALDVTDYKRAEAALRINERMATVGTLAAGVAHEINNPLSYVIANLERALSAELDGEALQSSLRGALEGATRVRDIVRDLRTLSRDNGDETADQIEDVDVEAVLDSAVAMASVEHKHRARVIRDYGAVRNVRASSGRLGQVFLNLLMNAALAIEPGAVPDNHIRIRTRDEGDMVAIVIEDTGAGIPQDVLGRIFDPFFTTRSVGEGTGLGLSISRNIVTKLGGDIAVESTVGEGTRVRVRLPKSAERAPTRPPTAPPTDTDFTGVSILVIDDEPRLTGLFSDMLEDADIAIAGSGREARDALAERSFEVILCDLMMPDVTGIELYETSDASLRPRFIFMTGGAFTANAAKFLRSIPNPCLEKPIELQVLRGAIAKHLQKRP